MVTVRRATLEDKPAIFNFIKKAYAGRWQYKIPERWQWEFVDNPFLPDDELPVWIAVEEDGTVVGQTCALVEPIKIGDELHRVGWSVDTFLLPEYRGQGIGFQLQKANDQANEIFMSLSMSKANRRIKSGLGSVPIDPVPAFSRLVRYNPESVRTAVAERLSKKDGFLRKTLRRVVSFLLVDRVLSAILNIRLRNIDQRQLHQPQTGVGFTEVQVFDDEINRLWEKVSPCYHAIIRRTDKYLNWKYVVQPHVSYRKFIARQGVELCGYIIFRQGQAPERNLGVIADLFAAPDDEQTIHAMLVFAVQQLKGAGVKDIQAASTVLVYQEYFRKLGFHEIKGAYPMVHSKIESPACKTAIEPGTWFLGKGDHDWDQFPLAR